MINTAEMYPQSYISSSEKKERKKKKKKIWGEFVALALQEYVR